MTISAPATQNSVPVASQWSEWSDNYASQDALAATQPTLRVSPSLPCVEFITTTESGRIDHIRLSINEPIVIGRNRASCTYVVGANFVSSTHCKISVIQADDGRLIVSCQDVSTNGIFLNDFHVRRSSVLVMNGDTITIPNSQTFECQYLVQQPRAPRVHVFDEPSQRNSKTLTIGAYILLPHQLGSGSFAEVHLALDPRCRRQVACKTIKLKEEKASDREKRRAEVKRVKTEVQILQSLKHPNINEVFASEFSDGFLHIFLQLCTGGDLFMYLVGHRDTCGRLSESESKYLTFQLFNALEYLHERCIAHRDLKPENILLHTPGPYPRILIADFGLAKPHAIAETFNVCGTVSYLPPEAIRALDDKEIGYIGMPADCWAAGVLMFIMLSGSHPFDRDVASWWSYRNILGEDSFYRDNRLVYSQLHHLSLPSHSIENVTKGRILRGDIDYYPIEVWTYLDGAKALIESLLVADPYDRITISMAFRSPWIEAEREHLDSLYRRKVLT